MIRREASIYIMHTHMRAYNLQGGKVRKNSKRKDTAGSRLHLPSKTPSRMSNGFLNSVACICSFKKLFHILIFHGKGINIGVSEIYMT